MYAHRNNVGTTAGMGFQLAKSAEYMSMLKTLNSLPINNYFNVGTAAEMLEQNAASQTLNVALRKHQYFDWEELAITGISAGLLGSEAGQSINKKLNQLDHNTGLLSSELGALTKASLNATTGTHFNATDILKENLGNSVAQALVHSTTEEPTQSPETTPDELYLSDTLYNIAHPERSMEEIALQYYLNQSLNNENRHKFLSINKEFGIEDGYNALRFESDLIVNIQDGDLNTHLADTFFRGYEINRLPEQTDTVELNSKYTFEEIVDIQSSLKGGSSAKAWREEKGKIRWGDATRKEVYDAMNVETIMADPVLKMQFLDLKYHDGVKVSDLNEILKGKGRLEGTGKSFLKAAKANNVNVLYLVSHALLESQNGASYLSKTNNFFGMGAYDGRSEDSGSDFARNHQWDTIERGIIGAASYISRLWINHPSGSQKTLYTMRWNPVKPGQSQYATDVNWANSQCKRLYSYTQQIYKNDKNYHPQFIIPKYRLIKEEL